MSPSTLGLLALALSAVAAAAALLAAVWARSGAHKVDALAATVIPLLSRVKQRVDPDATVAAVVAAAAAAPPPIIIEPTPPPVSAAPLPVIAMEDDDERRESTSVQRPSVEPEEHAQVHSGVHLGGLVAVAPALPTAPAGAATPRPARSPLVQPSSNMTLAERIADRAHCLVAEAGAAAAHCKGFDCAANSAGTCGCACLACARRRALHKRAQREITGTGTAAQRGPAPLPSARVPSIPPPPPRRSPGDKPPRAKETLTSLGIAPGPRSRFDPRAEPDSNVEVRSPHRQR